MTTRRDRVPFDAYYFERRARQGVMYSAHEAFEYIYRTRHWAGSEAASGEGAGQEQTAELRVSLPALLRELQTRTLLDLPCGDFSWMRQVDLPVTEYVGADQLPSLIIIANIRRDTPTTGTVFWRWILQPTRWRVQTYHFMPSR